MYPLRKSTWNLLGFLLLICWFAMENGWLPLTLILLAAGIHECGHVILLKLFGVSLSGFYLSPWGAELRIDGLQMSYGRELMAVLAGPAANFFGGAAALALCKQQEIFYSAAGANFVLGIFNLLPLSPLDGGRCLRILLIWSLGPDRGAQIGRGVGMTTAMLLAALVSALIWRSGGNLWLAPVAVGAVICVQRECRAMISG